MNTDINDRQKLALRAAARNGMVAAGINTHPDKGAATTRVFASTIAALARRGLLTRYIHQDGGVGGRITDAGKAAL